MYVIRVWKNFKRYILHPLSRNDNTFTLLLKFPNFHFYTRQLIFENSFSTNKKKKKKQEERRFPEFHLYPGSLSVSRFLLMILGYKTSVGGGRRERENKGGGWRKRMKEKEREREGTHCKLNLKAGQMGAVTVARAPLFHPSWHFSSWPGQTKENDCGQPPGLVFRLRNLAAITPLTHYPRPRARFRVISSASDRTNASSWAPRVNSSPPLPLPLPAPESRDFAYHPSPRPRAFRGPPFLIARPDPPVFRLSFHRRWWKREGGRMGIEGWRDEGSKGGDLEMSTRIRGREDWK